MRYQWLVLMALGALALLPAPCSALWEFTGVGRWPESWPAELEPLREQSDTLSHTSCLVHQIPFTDRAQFEAALPHLLALASKCTPLYLTREKDPWTPGVFGHGKKLLIKAQGGDPGPREGYAAGVAVVTPNTGLVFVDEGQAFPHYVDAAVAARLMPGAKLLRVGPPWPGDLRDAEGRLPVYAVPVEGKWTPLNTRDLRDIDDRQKRDLAQYARIEVCLIVDGEVVDLNRIKLPALIDDRRFDEAESK